MAIPTRSQQIQAIKNVIEEVAELDDDEVPSSAEFAARIVDAFHLALSKDLKPLTPPLRVGLAFKSAISTKVHHVAWTDGELMWIITADSKYGWLHKVGAKFTLGSFSFWDYIEESKAKAGAPGNNPKWNVGDKVMGFSTKNKATVIATGDKTVLLQIPGKTPWAESNENLEKYYKGVK